MTEKKTKKAYQTYTINPSIVLMNGVSEDEGKKNRFVKAAKEKQSEEPMLVTNPHTGEERHGKFVETKEEDGKMHIPFITDSLPYEKLYADLDLSKLSASAICVLQHIRRILKPKQHIIGIYAKECMEQFGWGSKSNYYKAIANLLENEVLFVKAGVESEYFLNVNKIYNGDRTVHYRDMKKNIGLDKNYEAEVALTKAKYLGPKKI